MDESPALSPGSFSTASMQPELHPPANDAAAGTVSFNNHKFEILKTTTTPLISALNQQKAPENTCQKKVHFSTSREEYFSWEGAKEARIGQSQQEEVPQAKAAREQAEPEQAEANAERESGPKGFFHPHTDNTRKEHEPDNVWVPGVGNVDRKIYDIGTIENHEDGTYTITDMTGRRYDYPTRIKPGEFCTIS